MSLVETACSRCLPCWGGEFAIALAYFKPDSPWRSPEWDRRWLEFQIWKEWYGSGVYGPRGVTIQDVLQSAITRLQQPKGPEDLDTLQGVCGDLDFAKDELAHFSLLMQVWQQRYPAERPRLPEWGQPGQELMEYRYRLREDRLGEIAVRLSEGGGLGLFFGIQQILKNSSSSEDKVLYQAIERILEDEIGHLVGNFRWAAAALSSKDIETVVDLLHRICTVKLVEREVQFGIKMAELPDAEAGITAYHTHYLRPLQARIIGESNAF
jgi:hypothetical protein